MLPKWLQTDTGKIITGLLLVFIPIISYTLLFPFYQNCINVKMVMLIYVLIGGLIGAGVAYWFRNKPETLIETFQLFMASIFLGMVLIPLFATFANRLIRPSAPKLVNTHIVKVEKFMQSRFGELEIGREVDGYFIYSIIEKKVVRLNADRNLDVDLYEPGSNIEVAIHQGLLGLRWVDPNFKLRAED